MASIGTLVSFTAGLKVVSADVNSNFSAIRSAFNTSAVLTDTATTIVVTHSFTVRQQFLGGCTLSGHLLFSGDNTYDIGASGATRPRDLFLGRSLVVGTTAAINGTTTISTTGAAQLTLTDPGADGHSWSLRSFTDGALFVSREDQSNLARFSISSFSLAPAIQLQVSGMAIFSGNVTCAAALNVAGALTVTGTATLGNGTTTNSVTAASGQALLLASDSNRGWLIATATGKVNHNGVAGVVVANATLATAATVGFLYIPTMGSTATGTPAAETGTVALAYETGNNHLMVYAGGAWKQVALT